MNVPPNLSKIEQIRARDGDHCWLCFGKLDFKAEPNSKKAPTKEHLIPQSAGGTNELANLVLCHPGCNKQLGAKSKDEKLAMRAARQAGREKQQAKRKQAAVPTVTPAPAKVVIPKAVNQVMASSLPVTTKRPVEIAKTPSGMTLLQRWQAFALASAGVALLVIGILIGLLIAS